MIGPQNTRQPRFRLQLHQPGLPRPREATELSGGTFPSPLQATALVGPRRPPLLVLNGPENSFTLICCPPGRG